MATARGGAAKAAHLEQACDAPRRAPPDLQRVRIQQGDLKSPLAQGMGAEKASDAATHDHRAAHECR